MLTERSFQRCYKLHFHEISQPCILEKIYKFAKKRCNICPFNDAKLKYIAKMHYLFGISMQNWWKTIGFHSAKMMQSTFWTNFFLWSNMHWWFMQIRLHIASTFTDFSSLICISVVKVNWFRLVRWVMFMNLFMLLLLFVLISLWWWRCRWHLIDFILLLVLCNCCCSQTPAGLTRKKSDLWPLWNNNTCMLPTDQLFAR